MTSSFKSALVLTTAAVIALTSFDPRPAAAAPEGGRASAKQDAAIGDLSAARKRRRYRGNPAIPLAAFGAIIGGIASIAAAQRQREVYYYDYYAGPDYGPAQIYYPYPAPDYGPAQVYEPAPVYGPAPYAYGAPRYRQNYGYRQHAPAPHVFRAPHAGRAFRAVHAPHIVRAPHFGGRGPANPNAKREQRR